MLVLSVSSPDPDPAASTQVERTENVTVVNASLGRLGVALVDGKDDYYCKPDGDWNCYKQYWDKFKV